MIDIAVTEDIWGAPLDDLATRWSVVRSPTAWQEPGTLAELASTARALVVRNRTTVDAALLAASPRLRIVARAGVGLDNIDVAAADARGVVVTVPLGANADSVAEHTLGLALALARRTVALDAGCRAGEWDRTPGIELRGRTWGLLGAGATARACARLAGALGMTVLAHDPYLDPADPRLVAAGIHLVPLVELAARCDVLSCHLPATAQTTGLIDATLLARLRPSVLFINVGRGEVVDEDDLADALESGALAGAALDVRHQEPPPPSRLDQLANVIRTPHIAGITAQSQDRVLRVLAGDIDAVLTGKPPMSPAPASAVSA
ncbi:MAG TPA: hydroxyacid dehydrogenase [Pseudonocardiaceae bacterium]|jgi:phosphoglycerate dehydrogenase-like enzyme|nr:hydroxyacid dehydrogenase [Pseudonocardiaceae bacterium]